MKIINLENKNFTLNSKAIEDIKIVSQYITETNINIDMIISSNLNKQPVELMLNNINIIPEVYYIPKVYSHMGGLLNIFEKLDNEIKSILVIGHNPHIQRLAILLSNNKPIEIIAQLKENFPPGSLVGLEIDTDKWDELLSVPGDIKNLYVNSIN